MQKLAENIKELEKVTKQLAKLKLRQEELTDSIILDMQHDHEGQRTYEFETWKIEIKTPVTYSLNKKLYESGGVKLPSLFNPIRESISYTVDKRLCDEFMQDAPEYVKQALVQLIDKKPGKSTITIKDRI